VLSMGVLEVYRRFSSLGAVLAHCTGQWRTVLEVNSALFARSRATISLCRYWAAWRSVACPTSCGFCQFGSVRERVPPPSPPHTAIPHGRAPPAPHARHATNVIAHADRPSSNSRGVPPAHTASDSSGGLMKVKLEDHKVKKGIGQKVHSSRTNGFWCTPSLYFALPIPRRTRFLGLSMAYTSTATKMSSSPQSSRLTTRPFSVVATRSARGCSVFQTCTQEETRHVESTFQKGWSGAGSMCGSVIVMAVCQHGSDTPYTRWTNLKR
jgi:hypothetical protein